MCADCIILLGVASIGYFKVGRNTVCLPDSHNMVVISGEWRNLIFIHKGCAPTPKP